MPKRLLLLIVAVLSMGLILAACGNNDDEQANSNSSSGTSTTEQASGDDTTAAAGEGTESGSSELRSGLTALLQEHVYLAGIAINTGVNAGLDSKEFTAAAGTLDENSKGLSEAIGGVYGDDAGKQFLALWRDHIGMFVAYTKAKATGDKAGVMKARKDLDGYRAEFGAFIASANPELTEEAVAEELKPHVSSVFATIDSVVGKKGDVFEKLRAAAGHMPGTANVLAGAIAKQMPDKFTGSTEAGASELRAGLTALLQEHVYLAGIAVSQGVGEGLDSKQFTAAAASLDENTKGLSEAIGSVYGDEAGQQFQSLWRDHIGMFVAYTKAKATGDEAGVKKARKDLDGYRAEFGAFLASANPELTEEAVADELKPHVASLFKAIDSVVAGKPSVFRNLRAAAGHMPNTANVLAGAIAAQMPDKFPSS